jgi:hypothetical protein
MVKSGLKLAVTLILLAGLFLPSAAIGKRKEHSRSQCRHPVRSLIADLFSRPRGGSRTVAETKNVLVVRFPASPESFGRVFIACYKRNGRTTLLGTNTGGATVSGRFLDHFTANGQCVAFHLRGSPDSLPALTDQYRSVNVRWGDVRYDSGQVSRPVGDRVDPQSIVVAKNCTIAWLRNSIVGAMDEQGTRTLSTGAASNLSLSGFDVNWLEGGITRTARLNAFDR